MTAAAPAARPSAVDRLAATLGWTPGQVWTVALGLLLAVPAGILGLGPALDGVTDAASAVAAPAPAAPAADTSPPEPDTTPPANEADLPLPALLTPRPATAPGPSDPTPAAPAPPPPAPRAQLGTGSTTVAGPGEVRAIAVAADSVAVAVDRGPGVASSLVVVDEGGDVAASVDLVVDGVTHHGAGGAAVTEDGVVVSTASPPAVLLVQPRSGTVEAVAPIPDLPTCIPVALEAACQPGVDAAPEPAHVAVGDDGAIYVGDRAQACLFRIDGAVAEPWLCDIAYLPSPAVDGSGLRGVASARDRLVLTVRSTIDGHDLVEEIAVAGAEPGARRTLAQLDPAGRVDGADILGDGRVAVALTAQGAVLLLPPDGGGTRRELTGFERPVDVGSRGDALLVAQHSGEGAAGSVTSRPSPQRHAGEPIG